MIRAEFWGNNYYKHPPLTAEMVASAEKLLGVRLPEALISLLRIQNGGYTQGFAHPMSVRTTWAKDHVPLDELWGIVVDPFRKTAQNLLGSGRHIEEWGLPPKQVILAGDGHYGITLDYRNGGEPSVAWIDAECGEDIQVSKSFDSFLSALVPSSKYETNAEMEHPAEVSAAEAAERDARIATNLLPGDRNFYESLGSEDSTSPCAIRGCTRGRIKYSSNCRVHHFEQVWRRKCPFND